MSGCRTGRFGKQLEQKREAEITIPVSGGCRKASKV